MTVKNIIFTRDASGSLKDFLAKNHYSSIAVLVDENTKKHCYPMVKDVLPDHLLIEIESGETHKNLSTCSNIWEQLTNERFDRNSLLINLGGGVIGDMGGFCARTYKRGINFINIPTTLLAQVDANVGGKLGIDFFSFKNHIGLFSDPDMIIIDQTFLKTLPHQELKSGFAEVIKHHLIADGDHWQQLKEVSFDKLNFEELVPHSVNIKQSIVDEDPTEKGKRKILNFGHTIGHAVESYLLDSDRSILHGEGVALGMICEAYIAEKKEILSGKDTEEIISYLTRLYNKIDLRLEDLKEIRLLAGQDKKNKGNRILAALISKIGSAVWDQEITSDEIQDALEFYITQT